MAAPQPASLRRERERELVQATRALFDERGLQEAPIEEIARAVGIARGLIYRQFSSKEELYVLTVTDYLAELDGLLGEATSAELDPVAQLEAWAHAYVGFCLRYPAFLDCALSLMHRPAGELREALSDSVWLRLGQGIAGCVVHVSEILRAGARDGTFTVEDPDYMANVLWTQILGATHLARIRVGVRQARARDPGAVHGGARAARRTPAWPACWRPSAPSRQASARGAAAAFGRRHALRRAPAGGRVAARADGGRRRRALRRQVPRRRTGARRARGRGRRRRARAAAGPAGARAGDPRRCPPSWPAPSPTPRSRTSSTPARASTWAWTSCPGSLPFTPAAVAEIDPELAADVVWLDALTTNVDRTPRNPNLLVWHGRTWLIDHGAALFRQHGARPLASTAHEPFPPIADHVLLGAAGPLHEADERLADRAQAALETAVALVPEEWLGRRSRWAAAATSPAS